MDISDGDIWIKQPLFVTLTNDTTEGYKGYPIIGTSNSHRYFVDWTGSDLTFYVDGSYVGALSDKRLKTDFKKVDDKFLQAIEELEIQQFKIANRNGLISFGIIAQDLIEVFEKYGLNPKDYEILGEVQYSLEDNTMYYKIEYTQYLILKQLAKDRKIKSLEEKDKQKDDLIQSMIERIERLEKNKNE